MGKDAAHKLQQQCWQEQAPYPCWQLHGAAGVSQGLVWRAGGVSCRAFGGKVCWPSAWTAGCRPIRKPGGFNTSLAPLLYYNRRAVPVTFVGPCTVVQWVACVTSSTYSTSRHSAVSIAVNMVFPWLSGQHSYSCCATPCSANVHTKARCLLKMPSWSADKYLCCYCSAAAPAAGFSSPVLP